MTIEKQPKESNNIEAKNFTLNILGKIEKDELDKTLIQSERDFNLKSKLENKIMAQLVCDNLTEELEDELYELEFDYKIIENFKSEIKKYSTEDRSKILSYPWEVRKNLLLKNKDKILERESGVKNFLEFLLQIANQNGWDLGYHLSNADIQQTSHWDILGYELDDRDDMPMAYYSLDWLNRYKTKGINYNFLYLIRAEKGENSSHKLDTSNNWGRAPKLSIVHKISLQEVQEKTKLILNEYLKKKKPT